MKQVVCMKWGLLCPADYVNKLYGMVRRNTEGPLRFICMIDDAQGVREKVECMPCPEVDVPPPRNRTGWRKIALWEKELPGMEGDWLFLDLDVIVTGTLDPFFEYEPQASLS